MEQGYEIYSYKKHNISDSDIEEVHTHKHHEIFMLLEGSANYMIEGAVFPLRPFDIVIVGAGEPHAKCGRYSEDLKIFVINVEKELFEALGCPEYESIFKEHDTTEHVISAESAKKLGLIDAIFRLASYTEDFTDVYTAIAKFTLGEILFLINKKNFSDKFTANPQIKQIIDFINRSYKQKISLEEIAESTFLSKYYVCKLFKKHTGLTVKDYITKKRLASVDMLISKGHSITYACIESGFNDYSTFYNAFVKEHGTSPRELLKG